MGKTLKGRDRLLTEILNDVENDKAITWNEANRLKTCIESIKAKRGWKKYIYWSKVKLI